MPAAYGRFLEAFDELGTDRQIGFGGAGPIPYSSIRAWMEEHGMTTAERWTFRRVVRSLDAVYLSHQAERSKAKS